jgi:nucleoside-triphosphatase
VVEAASGAQEVLAHLGLPGPPQVDRYGVDLAAFERVALPALHTPASGVVVVDELGKMELASTAFRAAVLELLGRAVAVVAVQVRHHRFTDALKRRPDIRVVRVTEGTRDALPERLMERLVGGTPPREGAVTGASAPGLEAAARASGRSASGSGPAWSGSGRPGWSRATPTPRSSRSGRESWPTASCCTWPSPA